MNVLKEKNLEDGSMHQNVSRFPCNGITSDIIFFFIYVLLLPDNFAIRIN